MWPEFSWVDVSRWQRYSCESCSTIKFRRNTFHLKECQEILGHCNVIWKIIKVENETVHYNTGKESQTKGWIQFNFNIRTWDLAIVQVLLLLKTIFDTSWYWWAIIRVYDFSWNCTNAFRRDNSTEFT